MDPETLLSHISEIAAEYPNFPITKGLTGSGVAEKKTVNVGEVRRLAFFSGDCPLRSTDSAHEKGLNRSEWFERS
jgi:hypothetical protein